MELTTWQPAHGGAGDFMLDTSTTCDCYMYVYANSIPRGAGTGESGCGGRDTGTDVAVAWEHVVMLHL